MNKKRYYFDSAAYTPISKNVFKRLLKILKLQRNTTYGNSRAGYEEGRNSNKLIKESIEDIAKVFSVKPSCVLPTSGATEANYLAIRTAILYAHSNGISFKDMEIITFSNEHPSTIKACKFAETIGVKVHIVNIKKEVRVSSEHVISLTNKNTILISMQYITGVTGVRNNVTAVSNAVKNINSKILIHADCAQSQLYYNCSPQSLSVDMITLDASKLKSVQGVGALIFSSSKAIVGLEGKKDVQDIKFGTPPVALIAAFAQCIIDSDKYRSIQIKKVKELKEYAIEKFKNHKETKNSLILGEYISTIKKIDPKKESPHIIYIEIPNINHQYLSVLLDIDGFATSTNSVCNDNNGDGLRISFLDTNKKKDINKLIKAVVKNIPLAKSV